MITDAMVEAAAKAIWKARFPDADSPTYSELCWHIDVARIALEAAERARDPLVEAGASVLLAGRVRQSESAIDPIGLLATITLT